MVKLPLEAPLMKRLAQGCNTECQFLKEYLNSSRIYKILDWPKFTAFSAKKLIVANKQISIFEENITCGYQQFLFGILIFHGKGWPMTYVVALAFQQSKTL